mmetsp:Transcript_5708/g.10160  ORF Transcript_5708/g.10160 Transcript_5708/m.10160 type:complete len:631 (-) Transcript_5708:108-2000(-)
MATAEDGESAADGATETPAAQEAAESGASGAKAAADTATPATESATPATEAASSTTTAAPASGAPARQPRLSMGLMMTRQMEAIKRQKAPLESGVQRAGAAPRKVPPARPAEASSAPSAAAADAAPATVAHSPPAKSITPNSPAAKAMASHLSAAVSAASGAPADKAPASGRAARLNTIGNTAARRLGVPLKGSTTPVWKRLKVTGGSVKIASAARPAKAKAESAVRGRGAVKAGVARAAMRAASGKAGAAAAPPRSGATTRRAQSGAPGLSGALRAAAGALRAATATGVPRTAVSRPAKSAPLGSRLAAAARAAVARQPARPGRRAPGAVRPGGVFGAIMVKKQEDSDREEDTGKKGMALKVKAPSSAPRAAASRASAATRAPARRALGYGYGDVSGESDESAEATKMNGKAKPQMPARAPPAGRGGARPDLRGRNILGTMMGHLASAKRRLSDEKQGRSVKEEPGHWESKELEEPAEPPAKRARRKKREEPESEDAEDEEDSAPEADDEDEPEDAEEDQAEVDRAAEARELAELQKRLEAHYLLMKNFIRTRAEPTIFYLPAKHNSQTKRMLKETRLAIEQKISSLRVQLQPSDASDEEAVSEAGSSEPSEEESAPPPKAPTKRKVRR